MLSPAYSYSAVQTKDIFMSREEIREKFQRPATCSSDYNLMTSPIYLEFLRGERELMCTAWGNPTYNPRGWKGPCYLMTDAHHDTFKEFIDQTPWEKYGHGRDPRCQDCMVHVGLRAVGGSRRQPEIRRHLENAEVAAIRADGRAHWSQGRKPSRQRKWQRPQQW